MEISYWKCLFNSFGWHCGVKENLNLSFCNEHKVKFFFHNFHIYVRMYEFLHMAFAICESFSPLTIYRVLEVLSEICTMHLKKNIIYL